MSNVQPAAMKPVMAKVSPKNVESRQPGQQMQQTNPAYHQKYSPIRKDIGKPQVIQSS